MDGLRAVKLLLLLPTWFFVAGLVAFGAGISLHQMLTAVMGWLLMLNGALLHVCVSRAVNTTTQETETDGK